MGFTKAKWLFVGQFLGLIENTVRHLWKFHVNLVRIVDSVCGVRLASGTDQSACSRFRSRGAHEYCTDGIVVACMDYDV